MGFRERVSSFLSSKKQEKKPAAPAVADHAATYDLFENGYGEMPTPFDTVVNRVVELPGIRSEENFVEQVVDHPEVQRLLQEGSHVGVERNGASEVNLFISRHKKEIIKAGVIGGVTVGGAIAGTLIFMKAYHEKIHREKNPQKKQK